MVEEQVLARAQEVTQTGLQVEVISERDRFEAIGPQWDGLVERADVDPIFLSHAWFRTWWECFGQDRQLHIVTVRSGGRLVGAAPMMRTRRGVRGLGVERIESIYNPHTPRFDFIVDRDQTEGVYPAIWNACARNSGSGMIVLAQIPETSRTIAAVEQFARDDGWIAGRWIPAPSPYIRLGCDYDEFLKRLKGSHRYNLRKRQERLSKTGPIDVETITGRDAVREALLDGLRIEAAAWKGEHGTAIASDPAVTAFYTRLAEREAGLGHLRMTFLRTAGKRISFNYLLHSGKTFYGVKIGYDPEYHSYSPGNLLLNLILRDACAEGMNEYDFLGVDDAWKYEWTRDVRRHLWLFLFKNRPRPRILHYLKFGVIPKIRPQVERLCTYLPGRA